MNFVLLLGAVLGLSSVAMGAYADHGLSMILGDHSIAMIKTALHYQLTHAVLIIVLALGSQLVESLVVRAILKTAAVTFIVGCIFFSVGIGVASFMANTPLTYMAPTGGVLLMSGWLLLIIGACQFRT